MMNGVKRHCQKKGLYSKKKKIMDFTANDGIGFCQKKDRFESSSVLDLIVAHFRIYRTGILPIGRFLKLNKYLHIIHILKEEIKLSRYIMLANVSDVWLLFNSSFDYQCSDSVD